MVAGDRDAITALRTVIDASCACRNFDGVSPGQTRADFKRCYQALVNSAVSAGHIRRECRNTVKRLYAASSCGQKSTRKGPKKPCVKVNPNTGKVSCRVKPTGACTDKAGRQISCAEFDFCIDAADSNGDLLISSADSGTCTRCTAGIACDTGLAGECKSGIQSCPTSGAGLPLCTQLVFPGSEVCDGLDNDCNGAADDAIPDIVGEGTETGECQPEIQSCIGGRSVVVQPRVDPAVEICNDGRDQDCDGEDCVQLDVVILSPRTGATTRFFSIDVSGTVNSLTTGVEVNGMPAQRTGVNFVAKGVELQEGFNTITATALDAQGHAATSSVSVVVDNKPPSVSIDSHQPNFVTRTLVVDVSGLVNDIVVGTVNPGQATVTVNGVGATVLNRSYLARAVPLTPDSTGNVQIAAIGVDAVSNVSDPVVVAGHFEAEPEGGPRISVVSGSGQAGTIGSALAAPLVARLTDAAGNPVSGTMVVFRVTKNNGELSDGSRTADAVAVSSDANGRAQATWTLGTRAGAGNNVVEASAVGFAGPAVFHALAATGLPDRIVVDSGNQQTGPTMKPLARPLVIVVVDAGSNRLGGVPVTFTVQKGGGRLEGSAPGQTSVEVLTDSDGRALAVLTLGPEPGIDNNAVSATFPGNTGFPAGFVASAKVPGDPAETSISGVVLDNTDQPIEGVTIELLDSNVEVRTDANGQFKLKPVPVGTVFVDVDGRTTNRPGVWPTLEYEVVTVPGVDNPIPHPIYLLEIAIQNRIHVSDTEGGVLVIPELPGFSLTIAPGSVKFPNGGKTGDVSVTLVHADKIPMPPGFGQQPRLIVTIQPPAAEFKPPAPLTLPNVDGLKPGEVTELYSFDHDLGQFVAIGTGTVSHDGSVIASDPGVGIVEGGWHCGGNPTTGACAHQCPDCYVCNNQCVCEPLEYLQGPGQVAFCASHADCCVGDDQHGASPGGLTCALLADALEAQLFGTTRDGGGCNGFRHAFWMCCTSRNRGFDCAVQLGLAHEAESFRLPPCGTVPPGRDCWEGCPDTLADIRNNEFGAILGQTAPDWPACRELVLQALDDDRLGNDTPCIRR